MIGINTDGATRALLQGAGHRMTTGVGSARNPMAAAQDSFRRVGTIHDEWLKEKEEERKRSIVNDNMDNVMRGARADVMARDKSALAQVSEDSGKVFDAAKQRLGPDVSREDVLNSFVPGKEQTVREALMEKYHQSSYTPTQEEMQANVTNRLVGLGLDYNDAVAQSELSTKNFLKRDVLQKEAQAKLDAQRQSNIDRKEEYYKQANMMLDIAKAEGKGSKSNSDKNSNNITGTDFLKDIQENIGEGEHANMLSDQLNDPGINATVTQRRNMLAKTYGFKVADEIVKQSLNLLAKNNKGITGVSVSEEDIDTAIKEARKDFDPIKGGTGNGGASNAGRLAAAIELMEKADALDTRQRSVGNYEDARSKQFVDRSQRLLGLYGTPSTGAASPASPATASQTVPVGSTITPPVGNPPQSAQKRELLPNSPELISAAEERLNKIDGITMPVDNVAQTTPLQALEAWSKQNRKDGMYEAEDALRDPELSVFYDTQKVPNKADVLSYKEPSIKRPAEVQEIIKNLERMDGPELRKLLSKTDKNILGMGFSVRDLQNASDDELRKMYTSALLKTNIGSVASPLWGGTLDALGREAESYADLLGGVFSRASVDEQGNVIDNTVQRAEERKRQDAIERQKLLDAYEAKNILKDYSKNDYLSSRLMPYLTNDPNVRDSSAENSTPRRERDLVINEQPIDRLLTSGLEGNESYSLPLPTEEENKGFEFNDLFSKDIPSWGAKNIPPLGESMNIGKPKVPFGNDAVESLVGKTFTAIREGKKVVADLILANIKDFASGSSARKEWEAQANLAGEEVARMIDNKAPANSIRDFIAKEYKIFLPETVDFMEMDIDEIKRVLKEEGKIHL